MMLGEESRSADYWKACGDEALRHGIKGVIMMGAHWDVSFLLSCRDHDAQEKRQCVEFCESKTVADALYACRREGRTVSTFP
jgi:hypothetical protein